MILMLALTVSTCSNPGTEGPSLVVFVVVDQMRADLLERYDSLYTGGFRRLLDGGYRFLSATHDHAETATAPGHATLSTGVYPSRNGIVTNDWFERTAGGWQSVYCFEDTSTHILGLPALEGRSPRNLLRGGLANWVQEADSRAVIASASRKDRAAIALAGTTKGNVYWITENEGRWVTSSFYARDYPRWVDRINRNEMPRLYGDSIWEQTMPPVARAASRADTSAYEGDGVHTFFPHRFHDEVRNADRPGALNRWAYAQTYPDAALAAFAAEALSELDLGKDGVTDFLGLSFSQVDAVGHAYGPLSREQLQNLLHLDQVLGDLMRSLDEEVGENRWVMALTADHGVFSIPEYVAAEGLPASRATAQDFSQLREVFGEFSAMEGDSEEIADSLVAALERLPFVGDAMSIVDLTTPPSADSFTVFMRNSYHPDRWIWGWGSQGSGVAFRFVEGYYPATSARGTGHGSPYYYDRHVPLVFFGKGVARGVSSDPVRTVDVAPTLAALAGIPFPSDLDGKPLLR